MWHSEKGNAMETETIQLWANGLQIVVLFQLQGGKRTVWTGIWLNCLSLCVYVCVHVCVREMCTCLHTCMEARGPCQVSSSIPLHITFERVSLAWKPQRLSSPPPQLWDYKCVLSVSMTFHPGARDWTWVLQPVQQTLWHLNCLPQSPSFPMLLAENVCISQNTEMNTRNIYNTEIISQCLNFKNKPLKHKTWVLKSVLVPKTQQYFTN